jgi:SAM-dependent methyltransferase
MALPWWAKVGSKLVLARLPFGYTVWQRVGLFRHGAMDDSGYAIDVFEEHVRRAGLEGKLNGRTLLELGPGDSISTAILAAAHGARAVLIDAGPFVRADVAPYRALAAALAQRGHAVPDLSRATGVRGILEQCGARYLTRGLASFAEIADASIDFIFSQAVLEHVRRHEFAPTMRECRRVLKRPGLASHRVDLKDHLGGALNNLRFKPATWESDFFASSGFYTNRLRFTEMLALFSEAGFAIRDTAVRRWPEIPTPRHALAPEFRQFSDDELSIHGFDVLLG